jgi:hypothetical protein
MADTKVYMIHHISRGKGWQSCLRYSMEHSDSFAIIFQGDVKDTSAEGLNVGKKEFLALPAITIAPYRGMKESFLITGPLTDAAQELFLYFLAPSFEGYTSRLWSFQFLRENVVTISVEDFSTAFLVLDESELDVLSSRGIDTTHLDIVDSFSNSAEEFVPKLAFFSRELDDGDNENLRELELLSEALKKTWELQ